MQAAVAVVQGLEGLVAWVLAAGMAVALVKAAATAAVFELANGESRHRVRRRHGGRRQATCEVGRPGATC